MDKKKSKMPLIIAAGVVWVLMIGTGLFILVRNFNKHVVVSEQDEKAVVGAFDLVPYFEGFSPSKVYETLNKSKWFDQSVEIEYEYDSPVEGEPYILLSISQERTNSDASASYMTQWTSFKLGFNASGESLQFKEAGSFVRVGDRSRFANVSAGEELIGQLLVAQKGLFI